MSSSQGGTESTETSRFATGISVDDARERILRRAGGCPPRTAQLTLGQARGRILAVAVHAPLSVPPFANSAMDGFAVRGSDLPGLGERALHLRGTRLAGDGSPICVEPGECVRVTTGAPVPPGADTIVIKENVRVDGDTVWIAAGETAGSHVRPAGEDYLVGDLAFAPGTVLTPARLGVLASFGMSHVEVVEPVRAIVLTTGDEIAAAGFPLGHGQIYNSNQFTLSALLEQAGAQVLRHQHVRDDPEALRVALRNAAAEADIVISSGGVSAGEADFLPRLLQQVGTVDFWKVRMKPGMPMLFGSVGEALVFALPGNPVSSMATFLALVRPALDALAGRPPPRPWHARLSRAIVKNHRRAEFQRARWESRGDGSVWVTPFLRQGSGVLRSVAEADCLIVLSESDEHLPEGSCVPILPLPENC
ncbi:molybdopterin molybdotransferase MoeA [Tahibacter amnicola]|uniref:Molybdopterin molybdenumtransferase n=1 Tax=Tahibacter amnicola TaxID=2976241 RepID=A0ABY6BAP7_9GAMM|nr:gephyrin-like molybdotransferase Glp [Tahibacter amnicola]UXI66601.1 molybdopterin molybdotransferase MoeA [Tahibacter amnicola]